MILLREELHGNTRTESVCSGLPRFVFCLTFSASYLRRRDKSMSSWVSIVPGSEVPVEGRDDSILLSFLHVLPEGNQNKSPVRPLI